MDPITKTASLLAPEWIEALIKEHEDQVLMEAHWPIKLMQSVGREHFWELCRKLDVEGKGVPGTACQLLERYLARYIRAVIHNCQHNEAVREAYKFFLESRIILSMAVCIQLAAKMNDEQTSISATKVMNVLLKEGIAHSKKEIIKMEFHIYKTLDFRIPLWTNVEIAEFLATQVGIKSHTELEVVALVTDLAEYYRDQLDLHMRCWNEFSSPGTSSSNKNMPSMQNLPMCAGSVAASLRYMGCRYNIPDITRKLTTITRTNYSYVKAIGDTLVNHIITERKYIPILKKRRLLL